MCKFYLGSISVPLAIHILRKHAYVMTEGPPFFPAEKMVRAQYTWINMGHYEGDLIQATRRKHVVEGMRTSTASLIMLNLNLYTPPGSHSGS
jgi:hypothetical protein